MAKKQNVAECSVTEKGEGSGPAGVWVTTKKGTVALCGMRDGAPYLCVYGEEATNVPLIAISADGIQIPGEGGPDDTNDVKLIAFSDLLVLIDLEKRLRKIEAKLD